MLLSGELASRGFVQRFRTEASAAALLQHPNIVATHEVGVHDSQHYFSMDYVEGTRAPCNPSRSSPATPETCARWRLHRTAKRWHRVGPIG